MRKLFSLFLSAVMLYGVCVPAYAAPVPVPDEVKGTTISGVVDNTYILNPTPISSSVSDTSKVVYQETVKLESMIFVDSKGNIAVPSPRAEVTIRMNSGLVNLLTPPKVKINGETIKLSEKDGNIVVSVGAKLTDKTEVKGLVKTTVGPVLLTIVYVG